jgi:hypothetical protein
MAFVVKWESAGKKNFRFDYQSFIIKETLTVLK